MRRLNVHSIAKQLNMLCSGLISRYNINCGGCCFIASEIAKHFDRLGLKYELRIYDNCGKNQEAISKEVRRKCKNNSDIDSVVGCYCCSHYFLWLEGAGAINEDVEYFRGWTAYSIKDARYSNIKWIYRVSTWNSCYDTSNNQKIKKIINSYFEPYEQAIRS